MQFKYVSEAQERINFFYHLKIIVVEKWGIMLNVNPRAIPVKQVLSLALNSLKAYCVNLTSLLNK
jgi:hypothetical protein